jgi:hypothetical protein
MVMMNCKHIIEFVFLWQHFSHFAISQHSVTPGEIARNTHWVGGWVDPTKDGTDAFKRIHYLPIL